MKENVKNSEIMKSFNAARKAAGLKEVNPDDNKIVGNNGYTLNQQFTLDGTIAPEEVKNENGVTTAVYLALGTTNGAKLSLQALMGLSSLRGYELSGTDTDSNGNVYTAQVADDVDANFVGWSDLISRDLYEMAAAIEANPALISGRTATFKGVVIRKWTAKKAGTDLATGKPYAKGAQRVSAAKLWSID